MLSASKRVAVRSASSGAMPIKARKVPMVLSCEARVRRRGLLVRGVDASESLAGGI